MRESQGLANVVGERIEPRPGHFKNTPPGTPVEGFGDLKRLFAFAICNIADRYELDELDELDGASEEVLDKARAYAIDGGGER